MGFIFGGDTEMSYEDLQRKRSRADTIAASLTRTPKNVGEGLHAIGQALAARGIDRRVQKRQGELDEQWKEQVAGMGLGPDRAAIFASLPYEQRASASLNWLNQQDAERRAAASRGAAASERARKEAEEQSARQAIAQALSGQTTRAPMPGPTTSAAAPSALPSVADGGVMGANSVPVSQPSPVMQTTTTPPTQSSIVQALIGNQNVPINQIDDIVGLLPEAPETELRTVGDTLLSVQGGKATPIYQGESSPLVQNNVNAPGQKFGEGIFEDRYEDILNAANSAADMDAMLDVAEGALSSGVRTGFGAEQELQLRRLGQAVGIDVDDDAVAGAELLKGITNRMALLMRSPDSGMGMPGAVSDRDLTFLKDAQVGIERSDAGNRNMLIAFRALNQRKRELRQLADDYIARNGRLDIGFNNEVQRYAEANPLFTPETFTFSKPEQGKAPSWMTETNPATWTEEQMQEAERFWGLSE